MRRMRWRSPSAISTPRELWISSGLRPGWRQTEVMFLRWVSRTDDDLFWHNSLNEASSAVSRKAPALAYTSGMPLQSGANVGSAHEAEPSEVDVPVIVPRSVRGSHSPICRSDRDHNLYPGFPPLRARALLDRGQPRGSRQI